MLGRWSILLAIAAGTLASEDLTTIGAGLLVRRGALSPALAILACAAGIYVGDLGLWLVGRIAGARLFDWPWLRRCLPPARLDEARAWLGRHRAAAILASRFLPGTRLPLYLSAGVLGGGFRAFAFWTLIATLVWTPLLLLVVVALGPAIAEPLEMALGLGWAALPLSVLLLYGAVRGGASLTTARGRGRIMARLARIWRWEFWPPCLLYAPLVPWLGYLAIRHRGLTTFTAANPAIPHGGVVGESKYSILRALPAEWVVPTTLIPPGAIGSRVAQALEWIELGGHGWPIVLKPDVGQRGAGVRLAHGRAALQAYLAAMPAPVLVQRYHPGPFEAGIFYARRPGAARGRIFSITDKRFPVLTGDGRSTFEELIWSHPRLRMQARVFLQRHRDQRRRVLGEGETVRLTIAGNHCQGAEFRDGADLITPALEAAIDTVSRAYPGFYFGRFDVRYADRAQFMAGRDLAIVELNGVTSESTNIYDPDRSLGWAYATLLRQWRLAYEIGDQNRRAGHSPTRLPELLRLLKLGTGTNFDPA
jgi:membrane protein DedA with SNARE-associated domain